MYIRSLSGIRAVACIWVIFYHLLISAGHFSIYSIHLANLQIAPEPLMQLIRFGWFGVDVFFMLSGFVIMMHYRHYVTHHTYRNIFSFLKIRLARIYPMYACGIGLLFLLVVLGVAPEYIDQGNSVLYHLTLTYAWPVYPLGHTETWNFPGWSLSVEWFLYLIFPLLALLLVKLRNKTEIGVILLLLAGFAFVFSPLFAAKILGFPALLRGTLAFCFGMLAYRFSAYLTPSSLRQPMMDIIGVICVALMLACFTKWLGSDAGFRRIAPFKLASLYLLITVFLVVLSRPSGIWNWLLGNRIMDYLGKISYSLYILQFPLFQIWRALIESSELYPKNTLQNGLVIAGYFATLIAISALTYRLVEKPAIRYVKARTSLVK